MNTFKWILAGVTALLPGPTGAWSGEQPASPWETSPTALPFITPESSVSVGIGHLSGDRQQAGMFDGRDHTRGSWLLDANLLKREEATGTWSQATGRNLGLDGNREIGLGFERQGVWGVRLDYNEIPFVAPYTANSKNTGLGTTDQTIARSAVAGDGTDHHLGTGRDRITLNTFRTWNKNIKFNLNYRNETKEGTRQWGGVRGSSSNEFLLEPVDWTMRHLEPTLGYAGQDLQLLGGYSGSWFKNDNTLVNTLLQGDNPALLANHVYLSQPLDNEAHQVYLSGGYSFATETRGTFKLSYGRALQNEHFPTMDFAGLSAETAPPALQGRVDTVLLQLGLTTQPLPKLSITSKLRYFDESDHTPPWLVVKTPTAQVHTTPVSIRTVSGQLEGTYRLPGQTALTGGVEHKEQERSVPYGSDLNNDALDDERYVPWRTNLDETTYRLRLNRNLSETINGSIGFEHGIRKGSQLVDSARIMGNARGKIAPHFIADRERNKLRLATDWRPVERLGFQFNVENVLDHYGPDPVPYGQQKGYSQLYSMDMDYAPSDKWLFTAWYAYDINQTWLDSGRWTIGTNAHEADKSSVLTDSGSSLGLGVRNQWNEKLKLGTNLAWTRTTSSFDDTVRIDPLVNPATLPAYPTGLTPLPEIVSPMTRFNAFLEYKGLGPGLLRCDYVHERWSSNDWTWKFSDGTPYTYGTTTDSTRISTQENQTADYLGVRYTTRFQ
ncbi:MAG: MtrB/PioB family decaheme-associated outer membrane protein [Magnetococcales bacterium]|nr:MtrB/PioB family decaheme-associated outer membrane protein [Magnetococcales bacterium]